MHLQSTVSNTEEFLDSEEINKLYLYKYAATICLGSLQIGFATAESYNFFHVQFEFEYNFFFFVGGAIFGCFFGAFLIEKGRRKAFFLANYLILIYSLIATILYFSILLNSDLGRTLVKSIFRIFLGISSGYFSMIIPIILKEVSPLEMTGTIGSFHQLFIVLGCGIAMLLTWLQLVYSESIFFIKVLFFSIPAFLAILQTILLKCIFIYETPKYLILTNRQAESELALVEIYPSYNRIMIELRNLYDAKKDNNNQVEIYWSQIGSKSFKRALIIGCLFNSLHGLGYTFGDSLFIPLYYRASQEKIEGSIIYQFVDTLVDIVASFAILFYIDKIKKNSCLFYGLIIMGFCLLGLVILLILRDEDDFIEITLILTSIFRLADCGSIGSIGFFLVTEILPPKGVSLAITCYWIVFLMVDGTIFLYNSSIPRPLLESIYILSIILFVSAAIGFPFLIPETTGKTEKEIKHLFINSKVYPQQNQINASII